MSSETIESNIYKSTFTKTCSLQDNTPQDHMSIAYHTGNELNKHTIPITQESAHQLLQDAGDWLRNYRPVQRTYIPKVHISRLYGHYRYRLRMRNNYKDYNTAQAILKYIDRTYKPKSVRLITRLKQRTCSTQ